WPLVMVSPSLTLGLKPSPFISTVSTPTWISTSTPPSPWMPSAWPLSGAWVMVPLTGAKTLPSDGSMPQHLPRMPCANTSSGICSIGTTVPLASAASVIGNAGAAGWAGPFFKKSKKPMCTTLLYRGPRCRPSACAYYNAPRGQMQRKPAVLQKFFYRTDRLPGDGCHLPRGGLISLLLPGRDAAKTAVDGKRQQVLLAGGRPF